MRKKRILRPPVFRLAACTAGCALAFAAAAQQLPDLGSSTAPWKVDVYYDNHTAFRGKDHTGERVGLSKFRNTLQLEADKDLGDDWAFRGILRGTWDGVHRMNKGQYGNSAGGAVMLQSTTPGGYIETPHGAGPVNKELVDGLGLTNNAFVSGAGYRNSPNEGLRVLGDRLHDTDGGVAFGSPGFEGKSWD